MHSWKTNRFRSLLLAGPAIAAALFAAGCAGNKLPGVFRLDIQQGNVITQEMIEQIELGMEKRKVRFILGTPLLTDPFNQDRWDYLYSLKRGNGERIQRHISLLFENDLLMRIEGDIRGDPIPESAQLQQETVVTVPAERRKKGFFAGLVPGFLKKDSPARKAAATTPEKKSAGAAPVAAKGTATSTTEAEADAASISAEDSARLEQLFGDFGRLEGAAEPDTASRSASGDSEAP